MSGVKLAAIRGRGVRQQFDAWLSERGMPGGEAPRLDWTGRTGRKVHSS